MITDSTLSILVSFLGGLMCAELVQQMARWLRGRDWGKARVGQRPLTVPVPVSSNSQPRFRALDPDTRS